MTTPASLRCMAELVASSPQTGRQDAAGVDDQHVARVGQVDGLDRLGPVAGGGADGERRAAPS